MICDPFIRIVNCSPLHCTLTQVSPHDHSAHSEHHSINGQQMETNLPFLINNGCCFLSAPSLIGHVCVDGAAPDSFYTVQVNLPFDGTGDIVSFREPGGADFPKLRESGVFPFPIVIIRDATIGQPLASRCTAVTTMTIRSVGDYCTAYGRYDPRH